MGFLDHFLNAAETYLKHQAREASQRDYERAAAPRKRRVKAARADRGGREFDAAPPDADDPDCCIAKR